MVVYLEEKDPDQEILREEFEETQQSTVGGWRKEKCMTKKAFLILSFLQLGGFVTGREHGR